MKVYNKFVESKKEPSNKNDIWFDGEVFNIYKEGRWQAFTFRVSDAEAVIRIVREFVAYYNDDIKPTVQEAQEAASRIETYVSLAIEATETSTRNNELFIELNAQLAELFNELQSLIDASNTATSSAQEAASLANSQATLAQQATQETIEATVNANNAINTINTLLETLEETINNKVDKIPGKGLSTNDFTDEDKGKLAELSNKVNTLLQSDEFDKQGNYPLLHVGTADDLAGRGESVPAEFGFRASGGKSIKDGRAYIKRIKGNSVVWNQYCQSAESRTHKGVTFTNNGDGSWTINGTAEGGTALVVISPSLNNKRHKWLITGLEGGSNTTYYAGDGRYINSYNGICDTAEESVDDTNISLRVVAGVSVENLKVYPRVYDLTQMFQAGNEPTTIEEFNARVATLGVDMNAYNDGQVIHCNTESIKSVGDNAYNKDRAIQATVNDNTGELIVGDYATMVDLMACLPNTQYYFANVISYYYRACVHYYDADMKYIGLDGIGGSTTDYLISGTLTTPANARFMRVGTYVNATEPCMVTLVHSGWKQDTDAGYQEYWQDTLPLPIIRKYFPDGMKLAGSAHDEIRYNKASGKWEYSKGRIKSVDLGTLNWSEFSEVKGIWVSLGVVSLATHTSSNSMPSNLLCGKYINKEWFSDKGVYQTIDGICIDMYGYLYLGDSSYTDVASFKAAMQGVILYYESNDWEWVELDAEDQNFRDYYNVADFGTEMSQSSVPSAPFSADIIYQFNAVDMIRENYNEIEKIKAALAKAGITI